MKNPGKCSSWSSTYFTPVKVQNKDQIHLAFEEIFVVAIVTSFTLTNGFDFCCLFMKKLTQNFAKNMTINFLSRYKYKTKDVFFERFG